MISLRYAFDLLRELARDTHWHEEVTASVKALEAELRQLNKKYDAATKRVVNQESSIAEHVMKRRRMTANAHSDSGIVRKRRCVSGNVKENRRHAVVVPAPVADVIWCPNEVSASSSRVPADH